MRKLFLKSGVACFALMGLGLAMPALAGHDKPVVQPVSQQFSSDSHVVAVRTLDVIQTGSADSLAASDDPHVAQVVAQTAALSAAPVIACPKGPVGSEEWMQLPEDLRRNAIPGQCFSQLLAPPQVETYREHVMVSPERVETRAVPEQTEMVETEVEVKPRKVLRKVVPAVTHFETATEVVRPATFREETIPAKYEMRTEHVMVKPPRQEWVRRDAPPVPAPLVTPGDHAPILYRADGELTWPGKVPQVMPVPRETSDYIERREGDVVWCLKQVDGVYETRTTRVEVVPAQVRRIEVPAVTREVRREVVDVPEHYEDVVVPAVTEKRRVRKVVAPARTEEYRVDAVYDDVDRQRIVSPAVPVWREVICGQNTSTQKIMEVQRALAAKGYQPGPIDGVLGKQTISAMQKFQADNHLPQGQPSVEAVRMLGVPLIPLTGQ